MKISFLAIVTHLLSSTSIATNSNPGYDLDSWNSQCDDLTFRYSDTDWQGKWSDKYQIGVSGGGWNKVHAEITSRPMNNGETFVIVGNKQQVGVGLCIDSCDVESNYGIIWRYNCVGFYGDGTPMLASDKNNKQYTVAVDRYQSSYQGFTYDQVNNCVTHIGSRSQTCTPLPIHFNGKAVRAIGQVWNSATAKLLMGTFRGPKSSQSSKPVYNPTSWNSQCRDLTFRYSDTDWQGKVSNKDQISVSGIWNKVHAEITSRPMNDGEKFVIVGNKQQVGVGLCIDSCDVESNYGIRWRYNCVGFYGDGTPMLASDKNNKEYTVSVDRYKSNTQGFIYDQNNNCVIHVGSRSQACTALPDHFIGKRVRAIGQVWNSASAKIQGI